MTEKKLKIVLFGNPVLRETAKPVTVFHKKLHSIIDSMKLTLDNRDDGAALAANQVGILKRITVIDYENEYFEMVNPEILESSGEDTNFEGCLSFPGFTGQVSRPDYVKVKFQDRFGKEFIIERKGNLARCIQHEIDHLNGILFIDRMKDNQLGNASLKIKIDLDTAIAISNGTIPYPKFGDPTEN
jgi:peptide deformylase